MLVAMIDADDAFLSISNTCAIGVSDPAAGTTVDRRIVRSSTGHEEERLVVPMRISVVGLDLDAEITLTNRDEMGFRMLVGREALRGVILVDPGRSYLGGRPKRSTRRKNRGAA